MIFAFFIQTTHVIAEVVNEGSTQYKIILRVGQELDFCGDSLAGSVGLAHQLMLRLACNHAWPYLYAI